MQDATISRPLKLLLLPNSLEAQVESLQAGEEKRLLTEGELRGLKKELRQLQRKAEGGFRIRRADVMNHN